MRNGLDSCKRKPMVSSMDDLIPISYLNDFIFCPVSIYFHKLYGNQNTILYQVTDQINGKNAHKAVDEKHYSSKKSIITGMDVYSEKYNLIGKIDILDTELKTLTERKKKIKVIYDGYIFQIYAQYFALVEMGYDIDVLKLYSIDDNKSYDVRLPYANLEMLSKFEQTIYDIKTFDLENYSQSNKEKCKRCIYEPACDRGEV